MKSLNTPLFKESIDYISQNPQAFSTDIPNHLLDYWILENNDLDNMEHCAEFGVFIYALLKYKVEKAVYEFKLPIDDLMNLFQRWQMALAVIEVNDKTKFDIKPFKLFDFDNLR